MAIIDRNIFFFYAEKHQDEAKKIWQKHYEN